MKVTKKNARKASTYRVKRAVNISSDDYASREYGVTPTEMKQFSERMEQTIASERKRGKLKCLSGNLEKDSAD